MKPLSLGLLSLVVSCVGGSTEILRLPRSLGGFSWSLAHHQQYSTNWVLPLYSIYLASLLGTRKPPYGQQG
jgi:hypothetical protein